MTSVVVTQTTINASVTQQSTSVSVTSTPINVTISPVDINSHSAVTLGTANGLSLVGQVLSLALSSAGSTGALSSADWTTFNGKQSALGFTPVNIASAEWVDLTDGGATTLHSHAGGGSISGSGVVGQLAEWVTNSTTLQAAKLIAPTGAILTLVNANAKSITFPGSTNDTVAMLATANLFTASQNITPAGDTVPLTLVGFNPRTANLQNWLYYTGNPMMYITADGCLAIGVGAASSNANTNLHVGGPAILNGGTWFSGDGLAIGNGLRITRTSATPFFNLEREGAGGNGNQVYSVGGVGLNSSSTRTIFSQIGMYSSTYTNAAEVGEIRFSNAVAGALTTILSLVGATVNFAGTTMVDNTADTVELRLQAHSTKTTHYLDVEESSGQALTYIGKNGELNVTFNANISPGLIVQRLSSTVFFYVGGSGDPHYFTGVGVSNSGGAILDLRGSIARGAAADTNVSILKLSATINPTSGTTQHFGLNLEPNVDQTGTATGDITIFRVAPIITAVAGTLRFFEFVDGANTVFEIGRRGNTKINQVNTTAAVPSLWLNQADLSEEFIRIQSTIGAGNPIDTAALGAYYGKMRVYVEGVGAKWLALYD